MGNNQSSPAPQHRVDGRPSSRISYRDISEGVGIDEVVINGVESLHIEALDDNLLWICVNRPNAERMVFMVCRARSYLRLVQTEPEPNQSCSAASRSEVGSNGVVGPALGAK